MLSSSISSSTIDDDISHPHDCLPTQSQFSPPSFPSCSPPPSSSSSSFSPLIDLWFGVEEQCQIKSIYNTYMSTLDIDRYRKREQRSPLLFIGQIQRTKLYETQLLLSSCSNNMINCIQNTQKQYDQLHDQHTPVP